VFRHKKKEKRQQQQKKKQKTTTTKTTLGLFAPIGLIEVGLRTTQHRHFLITCIL